MRVRLVDDDCLIDARRWYQGDVRPACQRTWIEQGADPAVRKAVSQTDNPADIPYDTSACQH
jgi:hypothetical protein